MFALFTMPDATTTLTNVGVWSSALFDQLLIFVGVLAGLAIAGYFVSAIIRAIVGGVKKVTGKGRSGGRRRR